MSSLSHQDWTPVVFQKKDPKIQQKIDKVVSQKEPAHKSQLKENTETFKTEKFDRSYISAAIVARTSLKLTQAELAKKLNVKEHVIKDFEQNKMVYDGSLKNKLNRVLGIAKNT